MKQSNNKVSEQLWSKQFIIILLINFLISISLNMQGTTIPMYVRHIGGSNTAVGMITGIITISALLFRPWFGNLLDNRSRRLILILGIIIFSIISFAYTFASTIVMFFILRSLQGIGLSAQSTAVGTIISDIVPRSKLGEGVGHNGVAATAATALGPLLGLFLIKHYSYSTLFSVSFIFVLLALICALLINYDRKDKKKLISKPDDEILKASSKSVFFEKTAILPAIIVFFIMFTVASVFAFLPSYALSRGVNNIGVFFTVYAFSFLVGRNITDRFSKRYGISRVIPVGMIFLIVSYVILSIATVFSLFLIAGILYGFGFSSTQPTLNTIALSLCPSERRGIANATFFSAMDIGYGLGAFGMGIISQNMGFSYIYFISAFCIILSLLFYSLIIYKKLVKNNDGSVCKMVEL